MLLGSKPFDDMSPEEMLAAIEELRSHREALRQENIKKKAEGKKIEKAPREKKEKEIDPALAEALKLLMGDGDA